MLFSAVINWCFGLLIEHSKPKISKALLYFGVLTNLAGLFYYKYIVFFVTSIHLLTPKSAFPIPEVILPIGISFYTFHAISYIVDIYRKEFEAEKNLFKVLLYIAMFPQLIAGPIVRYGTVKNELRKRKFHLEEFVTGCKFFIVGLGQKVLIANTIARPVDEIFLIPHDQLSLSIVWFGAIGYTFQIYFDFAGYSNMAIGLGLMVGIKFPLNFNYPYISRSLTEFWRRWHITLSTWFRDYVYIPLGGNQKGSIRTYFNLTLVFLLCGIWHGANWTFIAWGLYHGLFLVIERLGISRIVYKTPYIFGWLYTILVVICGWVIFRVATLEGALNYLKSMFGMANPISTGDGRYSIFMYLENDVLIAIFFGIIACSPNIKNAIHLRVNKANSQQDFNYTNIWGYLIILSLLLIFILSSASIAGGNYNPFIYFRF